MPLFRPSTPLLGVLRGRHEPAPKRAQPARRRRVLLNKVKSVLVAAAFAGLTCSAHADWIGNRVRLIVDEQQNKAA